MLALVGDHDPSITAHRAIPLALARANRALGSGLTWTWVRSDAVGDPAQTLRDAAGIWVVPGSPYASMRPPFSPPAYPLSGKRACGHFAHPASSRPTP